jgi:YesN/AraC family two-component response regulator
MKLTKADLEKLEQVKTFLEHDYKYHYTQSQLAMRFHISESKLRKGFVFFYKKTIHEYLIFIRIEKVKEFLADPDEPVKSIACKVGYDLKNMGKLFKKLTGLSPLDWRKKHGSGQFDQSIY